MESPQPRLLVTCLPTFGVVEGESRRRIDPMVIPVFLLSRGEDFAQLCAPLEKAYFERGV